MTKAATPSLTLTMSLVEKDPAESAFKRFRESTHFKSLDGLRSISILAVIWHHVAGDQYPVNSFFFQGHHGVTLFFVISGFLITSLLLREKEKQGFISLKKFYIRRALRIFPLYYTVLLIYCALVFIMERHSAAGKAFFDNLVYFATYTSNYFVTLNGDRVIFYFAWSLAAEEQFYMVWPAVQKWLNGISASLVCMALICVAVLADTNQLGLNETGVPSTLLQNIAIPICVGVLLAHAMHNSALFKGLFTLFGNKLGAILTMLAALVILATYPSYSLIAYVLFAGLIFSVVTNRKVIGYSILNHHWLIEIGKVSYGMYLFHMLSVNFCRRFLPNDLFIQSTLLQQILLFLLSTLLTFAIAKLSFVHFESFFLRQKKNHQTIN